MSWTDKQEHQEAVTFYKQMFEDEVDVALNIAYNICSGVRLEEMSMYEKYLYATYLKSG